MEQLKEEERRINRRIDEILEYDETSIPEINSLAVRVGVLWKNYSNLTREDEKELMVKSRELSKLRNKIQIEQRKELNELYIRLQDIYNEKLRLIPPIIKGDRLELKGFSGDICDEYLIFLKDTDKVIGNISYRGYHHSTFLADVGFTINPEYRGNNYAHEALCLLSDILYKNNIGDFWITAYKDNIASIKTILKYGAEELKGEDEKIAFYECKTREYVYNNKEVIR